jgi:hypothetical protein
MRLPPPPRCRLSPSLLAALLLASAPAAQSGPAPVDARAVHASALIVDTHSARALTHQASR